MRRYVVDANVAIKWYWPEELAEAADQLLETAAMGESRLLAPDLIMAELGNILWKKFRLQELSATEVGRILQELETAFPVRLYAATPQLATTTVASMMRSTWPWRLLTTGSSSQPIASW